MTRWRWYIPPLEDVPLVYRIVIGVVVVLVVLGVLMVLDRGEAGAEAVVASKYDKRILELESEAIESAFKTQIEHVFGVWMKDETGQPKRAITGAGQARRAFIGAMSEIDKQREK